LYTALLLALLLFFAEPNPTGETIFTLRAMLKVVRQALGFDTPWKRNTFTPRRSKKKPTKKKPENR